MSRYLKVGLLVFAGSLLMQIAWIVALPPFRGIDESDQAFRMAAVAGGQWHADYAAPVQARGDLVTVPRALINAATPVCSAYKYQSWGNCHAVSRLKGGRATVASAAARYNPVYYWVVGSPARLVGGPSSLLAMRVCAAVLCTLMLTGIAMSLLVWTESLWPWVGTILAMTPVAVYSTVVPAPNAVEMLGGLGLWATLIGANRVRDAGRERRLIWSAVPFAVCLTGVRALGPLWLATIVCSCISLLGWKGTRVFVSRHRRTWALATSLVLLATAAAGYWTFSQGTDLPGGSHSYQHMWKSLSLQPILWIFQSIAAFPLRNEPAPSGVYIVELILLIIVLAIFFLTARQRLRWGMITVATLSLAIPFAMSLAIYSHSGTAWQGRYALPLSMGVPMLAALGLEERFSHAGRRTIPIVAAGTAAIAVAFCLSITHVLLHEAAHSPLAGTSEWWIPPAWLVIILTSAGLGLWALACVPMTAVSAHALPSDPPSGRDEGADSFAPRPLIEAPPRT